MSLSIMLQSWQRFLCESRTELCKLLKDNRPARKRGGDRGNQHTGGKVNNVNLAESPKGNTRLYIEERLKRDHPKVWKDYYFGARDLFLAGLTTGSKV